MQIPTNSDIDLLLIGKTGNGKSATGNSILRKKVFATSSSLQSVTTKVSWDVSRHGNHVIKVVDGPGVGDTRMTSEEGINLFMNAMEFAVMANTQGYHAFLLVVRFGGRFTQEDQDTVRLMKQIFGQDFVRNYCILVMTCGDNFKRESEETNQTFEQWCRAQTGVMQELMHECQGRIVLFNNLEKDSEEQTRQLDRLLEMVAALKSRGTRYTDANFVRAQAARDRVRVEAKRPMIQDETMCQISLILQRLSQIQGAFNSSTQLSDLQDLERQTDQLVASIADQDKGTGALSEIAKNAASIQMTVREAIAANKRVEEERIRARQQEAEVAAQLERQREEMQRNMQRQSQEEREALDRRLGELEAQRHREKEENDMHIATQERRERERLNDMTRDTSKTFFDIRIKIDKDLFDSIVNFTRGIFTTIASWFKK